jgi:hypothetical protein
MTDLTKNLVALESAQAKLRGAAASDGPPAAPCFFSRQEIHLLIAAIDVVAAISEIALTKIPK